MRSFFKEYIHIIVSVVCTLIFGLGFYYILLNAFHASAINKKVLVSSNDVFYSNYQTNVSSIKRNLDNYKYSENHFEYDMVTMEKVYSKLRICYDYLEDSEEGLLKYGNDAEIGYIEVFNLNNYFLNSLVDKCFTSNISWIIYEEKLKGYELTEDVSVYNDIVNILGSNADYIKSELRDNSSYYYNTAISNAMVRNNLNSSYQSVAKNYYDFSKVILRLSNYLNRGEVND